MTLFVMVICLIWSDEKSKKNQKKNSMIFLFMIRQDLDLNDIEQSIIIYPNDFLNLASLTWMTGDWTSWTVKSMIRLHHFFSAIHFQTHETYTLFALILKFWYIWIELYCLIIVSEWETGNWARKWNLFYFIF